MDAPHEDTIAAIGTPPGVGGIGIIRVSGPDALPIVQKLIPKNTPLKPRAIHYRTLIHPHTHVPIDEACVLYFKTPQSYTGEDVIEIQAHSSPFILKCILSVLLENGARLAEKGEFSRRAFMNGKLSLREAESLIDRIHARTEKSYHIAIGHLKGHLYNEISRIRKELLKVLEHIEASVDFPDEVDRIDRDAVLATLSQSQKKILEMLQFQDFGKYIHNGVKCVILGSPNVGKSSLLNRLAGENRAIVTPIPGTTRDFVDIAIELGGLIFHFFDTAGIRASTEYIERLGIKKVSGLMQKADMILWVLEGSRPLTQDEYQMAQKMKKKKNVVLILNKSDKKRKLDLPFETPWKKWPQIWISSKKNCGIHELKELLYHQFVNQYEHINLDLLCNIRQLHCLKDTEKSIKSLIEGLKAGLEEDIVSIDLKAAILKLGELTGDEVTEEVLDGIFSRFCVGK